MQTYHHARARRLPWLLSLGAFVLIVGCRLPSLGSGSLDPRDVSPLPGESPVGVSPLPSPGTGGDAASGLLTSPWALPVLVGVGVLLFALTAAGAYLLLRGLPGGRKGPDGEVPTVVDEGAPLPDGTLLDEGRYLVLGVAERTRGLTTYQVKPTVAPELCPVCFGSLGAGVVSTCSICGGVLPDPRPAHPLLLARELADEDSLGVVRELIDRKVGGQTVVVPVAAFTETSFGRPRYFAVVPDPSSQRLTAADGVNRVDDVLAWGVLLAQGLGRLHQNGVTLRSVEPEDAVLGERMARWWCSDNVALYADDQDPGMRSAAADNVKGLARMLVVSATGESGLRAAAGLPEPVARVLQQVLRSRGALRAEDFGVALARAREQMQVQQPVTVRVGGHSDVGRLRKLNEDGFLSVDLSASLTALAQSVSVAAVADGVGGQAAGDVASRLAVEALSRETDVLRTQLASGVDVDAKSWIAQAGSAANTAVLTERLAAGNDMGSTLVMALIIGRSATVLNVGDSRAYWLTPSGMRQVTTDHSLVQRLIAIGQLTPEEARHHPQKSVIYRVLGDKQKLAYDLFEVALSPGEALLLCSDGLTDMVEDRVLWHVWREAESPDDACRQLIDLANEAGGYDNITAVIAQVDA